MALPSLPRLPGLPTSPTAGTGLSYHDLQSKYNDFAFPKAIIQLNKKKIAAATGTHVVVNDIRVELTSGFEASMASFKLYNVYDTKMGKFRYDDVKSQVFLGAPVAILMGYMEAMEVVFMGFVAGVAFGFSSDDLPYIEVTAMDIKGMMMGGTYSYQLTSKTYGEAVAEIFRRSGYEKLKTMGGISGLQIDDTPDKKPTVPGMPAPAASAGAETIELVAESDYDFVVKAAKKFNFEFFVEKGMVRFRRAKSNTATLAALGPGSGVENFRVEYSLTGLVDRVEARSMDVGKGKIVTARSTLDNTLSVSDKAAGLVGKTAKVFIDPTITTQAQADARVASLLETMSYRLGSMEADCVGIPELLPGHFITLSSLGAPADNQFYLTSVVHEFLPEGGYRTKLIGCTDRVLPGGLSAAPSVPGVPGI
ncbi:MAG: hypothetical protein RRY95_00930 [Oscillospiraceae bacterium]